MSVDQEKELTWGRFLAVAAGGIIVLFHSIAEIFSIVVAFGIFMVGWNSRRFIKNKYFLFLGIAYPFVGFLDLVHTLAYKGMNVFPGFETNLPTELWIAARAMESVSLLLATFFVRRSFDATVLRLLLASIFTTVASELSFTLMIVSDSAHTRKGVCAGRRRLLSTRPGASPGPFRGQRRSGRPSYAASAFS